MSISKLGFICTSRFQRAFVLPYSSAKHRISVIFRPENRLVRFASTKHESGKVSIPQAKPNDGQVSTATEKVKQAGKDVTYTGIVIIGLGVTGLMFYAIGRELFSGQSSSGVYGKALKDCKSNMELVDTLGEPVKGYGEMSSRGRRRHVSHTEYELEGIKHMRMKFYIEGPFRKGTVHLEVKKNDSGVYEYRYLFVELDGYPTRTIIIQDNR